MAIEAVAAIGSIGTFAALGAVLFVLRRTNERLERMVVLVGETTAEARHAAKASSTVANVVSSNQAWFWTPEWQAGEREADEDIAAGRTETFDSGAAFVQWLDEQAHDNAVRQ